MYYYFDLFDVIFLVIISYLMGIVGGSGWMDMRQTSARFGPLFAIFTAAMVALLTMLVVKGEC